MSKTSKKYVLFALEDLSIGGVFTVFLSHSKILLENGFTPILLGFKGNLDTQVFDSLDKRIIIHDLGHKSGLGAKFRILDFVKYLKALTKIYLKFQVVILHLALPWPSFYVLLHPFSWNKYKISVYHGSYGFEWLDYRTKYSVLKFSVRVGVKIRNMIQYFGLFWSNKIIVLSEYSRMLLTNYYSKNLNEKLVIIPGFLTEKRIKLDWPINNKFTAVNYGRVEYRKGLDILINSAKYISNVTKKFEIVCSFPYDPTFYLFFKLYENNNLFLNFRFLPKANHSQINTLLSQADLFVMPSRDYETFGLTVIEAMSYGVPVISSSAGALPETVGGFDKRFLVNPLTPKNLAKKILWYMNLSKKEKLKIRKNVYNYVYKKYWWENYSNELIQIYEGKFQ